MSGLYKTSEKYVANFCPLHGLHSIAPERGEYYRIGACPYLSTPLSIAPVGGAEFNLTMNYAPLTGSVFKIGLKKHAKFYMDLSF